MEKIKNFAVAILHLVTQSIIISSVFCLFKFIGHLCRLCEAPSWESFLYGAIALFIVFFIATAYKTILTMRRIKKDPIFEQMHLQTGISWKDYQYIKRLRKQSDNIH